MVAQTAVTGAVWSHSGNACEMGQPPPGFRGREEPGLDGRVFREGLVALEPRRSRGGRAEWVRGSG